MRSKTPLPNQENVWTALRTLVCSNNRLTSLPDNLINLEDLDCAYNELTSLPNNLTNLKTLVCAHNQITSLPNLTNIEELYCNKNQIKSLHNQANNWNNLISLRCYKNKLTSLPSLTSLKTLDCTNNQLASDELDYWKKIWKIQRRHQSILHKKGLERFIEVLKKRLYLPRLYNLHHELIWSHNHPGKFFTLLPRKGKWVKV